MKTGCKKKGFTLVELLVVIGIISLLMGILMPVANSARNAAKKVKQKTKLNSIEMALETFKTDIGDYPPSDLSVDGDYCGAQKLAEALVGWDLLGFHPNTMWTPYGDLQYPNGNFGLYDDARNPSLATQNLSERKGPYLAIDGANAYMTGDVYKYKPGQIAGDSSPLNPSLYVLCDEFSNRRVSLSSRGGGFVTVGGKVVTGKVGMPILYYRANTASNIHYGANLWNNIYNFEDNQALIDLGPLEMRDNPTRKPPLYNRLQTNASGYPTYGEKFFYEEFILDPKSAASAATLQRPYNRDTYLLISAGLDGLYGTGDDICNFGK